MGRSYRICEGATIPWIDATIPGGRNCPDMQSPVGTRKHTPVHTLPRWYSRSHTRIGRLPRYPSLYQFREIVLNPRVSPVSASFPYLSCAQGVHRYLIAFLLYLLLYLFPGFIALRWQ